MNIKSHFFSLNEISLTFHVNKHAFMLQFLALILLYYMDILKLTYEDPMFEYFGISKRKHFMKSVS